MNLVFGQKKKKITSTTVDLFPDRSILTMLPVNSEVKSPARRFEFNKTAIEELSIHNVDATDGAVSNTRVSTCFLENEHKEVLDWCVFMHDNAKDTKSLRVGQTTFSFSSKPFYDSVKELNGIEDNTPHYFELIPKTTGGYDVYVLKEVVIDVEEPQANSETIELTEELV